jgi:hypothetical protein
VPKEYQPDPVAVEHLRALHTLGQHVTEAAASIRGHMLNNILSTETVQIPASGVLNRDYSVAFGSVAVGNPSAANVTLATEQGGNVPTNGIGVMIVRPNIFAVHNIAARQFSVYGTPGATVYLCVYAAAQAPLTGPW